MLALVHIGVHVADDRPFNIATRLSKEWDRSNVLHLMDRWC